MDAAKEEDVHMSGTKIDLIKQLVEQMQAFGVAARKYNLADPDISKLDDGLRERIFGGFDYDKGVQDARKYCKEKTIYVCQDCFKCMNFSFLLPQEKDVAHPDTSAEMMVIGPFLTEIWEEPLKQITETYQLSVFQENMLREYYSVVPIVQSAEAFENLVFLQANYIYGMDRALAICRIGDYYGKHIEMKKILKETGQSVSAELVKIRYQLEEEMMAAVAAGDTERAFAACKMFSQYHMEWRDKSNSLRSAKNMMLVFNTLFRKAVQRAAVHPIHIDKISELYARKIEETVFIKDLLDISHEMIRKYCLLVRNYSLKGYSEVVCDTLNYIDCHLVEPISLKMLSEHVNVNASYLSNRFKKEVGRSVIDYVNWKKVEGSLIYLAATNMSMAEVAERVGIGDENYYSRLFKKYQGMTPRQYYALMHTKS